MEYLFQLSKYDQDGIEAQVSKALEKRTELKSRRKYPGLWRNIDRLNVPKAPQPVLRRRVIRYRIYGAVLLALGIFLFVPGLIEPDKLLVPLIAGVICLLSGLVCLLPRRKKPSRQFKAAASKLLAGAQAFEQVENAPVLVRFTQDGMMLPDGKVVPYDCFDAIVETESIYLFTWNARVTVLQKRDFIAGTHADFLSFMREKTDLVPAGFPD
ncbi:MAG: YcxB family protein [Clostridiales bacterium]|nr:YcxB family protein [Clostridiales bacterium]